MQKKLKEVLQMYTDTDYIDIEKIARKLGTKIDYVDFNEINGIIIGNRIGINKNISREKQRFTIAHELCHFLLNETGISLGIFASVEAREIRADEFATILLLPEKSIISLWKKTKNIKYLSEFFGVPEKVVRDRLVSLEF